MNAANNTIETIAARKRSEEVMPPTARPVSRAQRSKKQGEAVRC
jgi:hypothetical protein